MRYLLFVIALVVLASCNYKSKKAEELFQESPEEIHISEFNNSNETSSANESEYLNLSDFKLEIPVGWIKEEPESQMRVVQYALEDHPDLKVIGFYFGQQEEMREQNINRWKKEFTVLDNDEIITAKSEELTLIKLQGTFKLKPFPMAQEFEEVPDYMTLAAIVPSEEGPYFFKLVGPVSKIQDQVEDFKSFINSYSKTI